MVPPFPIDQPSPEGFFILGLTRIHRTTPHRGHPRRYDQSHHASIFKNLHDPGRHTACAPAHHDQLHHRPAAECPAGTGLGGGGEE